MVDKTESYYLTRLNNILVFMDKHDYIDNKYYNKVVGIYNSIIDNGLTDVALNNIQEALSYFEEEVYPITDSSENKAGR